MGENAQVEIKGVIPTDVLNNKIKVGRDKGNVGAGQIPKNKERMKGEFLRGYGAGIDDMKGMGPVDIVRVAEGDLKMSRLVYYHHHGGEDVSDAYLEGWGQAIRDAHKKTGEGKG